MDISLTLTIVFGFIGLISVFVGWKTWNRPRMKLVFAKSTLLANLSKASNEIAVSYKGEKVPNDLILIEGYLLNTGNTDIKKEDIEDPIEINLAENWIWHSFYIRKASNGLKVSAEILDNSVNLNLGLCKKGEGLYFDGLISLKDGASLWTNQSVFKNIKVNSRITNLDKVDTVKLPSDFEKNGKLVFHKDYLFNNLMIIAFMIFMIFSIYDTKDSLAYQFQSKYGNDIGIGYDNKNNIIVRDILTNKVIDHKQGFYEIKPVITQKKKNAFVALVPYVSLVVCFASFLFINYMWVNRYLLIRKAHKIEALL